MNTPAAVVTSHCHYHTRQRPSFLPTPTSRVDRLNSPTSSSKAAYSRVATPAKREAECIRAWGKHPWWTQFSTTTSPGATTLQTVRPSTNDALTVPWLYCPQQQIIFFVILWQKAQGRQTLLDGRCCRVTIDYGTTVLHQKMEVYGARCNAAQHSSSIHSQKSLFLATRILTKPRTPSVVFPQRP